MEDLWVINSSGVDIDEFADVTEYKRFLERFCNDEEKDNQRRLLYGEKNKK